MNNNKHTMATVCSRNGVTPWINDVTDSLMGGNLTNEVNVRYSLWWRQGLCFCKMNYKQMPNWQNYPECLAWWSNASLHWRAIADHEGGGATHALGNQLSEGSLRENGSLREGCGKHPLRICQWDFIIPLSRFPHPTEIIVTLDRGKVVRTRMTNLGAISNKSWFWTPLCWITFKVHVFKKSQ